MRVPALLAICGTLIAGEAAADPYAGARRPGGARLPFGNINFNGENIWTGDAGCSTTNMLSFCLNHYGLKPLSETPTSSPWAGGKPEGRVGHIQKPRVGEHSGHGFFQGDHGEVAALWRSGIAQWRPQLKPGNQAVWIKFGGAMVTSAQWEDGVLKGTCHTVFCGPPNAPEATMHFAVRFPREPEAVERIERTLISSRPGSKPVGITVDHGLRFTIDAQRPTIAIKLGTSWTSPEQALKNLDTEIPGWDLQAVKAAGQAAWDGFLGRVEIEAPPWLKRHVYTNLMDAVLHPDTFTDVDGQFCGFDLKTHQAKLEPSDATFSPIGIIDGKTVPVRGNRYHHFSSWDTKYAQQPLIALLWPEVGADIAQSFLDQARTGLGGFARWSIGQREFGTMEGDPSAIMIASTWSLGARTFEVEAALDTMIRVATTPGIECQPGFLARPGLGRYLTQGLARNDAKADRLGKPFVQWGNASPDSGGTSGTGGRPYSQTLDYAIADFGISRMALAHGKADIADRLLRQAQHWQAVIDPKTRMFIGQETNGGYAESGGRAAQFMVPHNWPKLAELMGGVDQALAHWNAHPPHLHNEDNHYAPWALNWLGRPWECQKYQRVAFLTQFCQPSGLARGERWTWSWPEAYDWSKLQQKIPGSNDLGAMTAMGFWMAVGIFPVLPGEAGFSVGSPIIPRIVLKRGTLGSLTVIAKDADPLNAYVQSLTVNGKAWNSSWIPGELLPFGKDHVLEFQMGKEPNQHWGNDPQPPHFDAVPWYKNPTP